MKNKQFIILIMVAAGLLLVVLVFKMLPDGGSGQPAGDKSQEADPLAGNYALEEFDENSPELQPVRAIDDSDRVMGGQGADVIVYMNVSDQLSRNYYQTLRQLLELYGQDLRVAVRQYFEKSDNASYQLATWVECAGRLGGTEAYYGAMDYFLTDGNFYVNDVKGIETFTEKLGLVQIEFNGCLGLAELKGEFEASLDEADAAGVYGSPATVIGGQNLPGDYPLEDFTDSSGLDRQGLKSVVAEYLEQIAK